MNLYLSLRVWVLVVSESNVHYLMDVEVDDETPGFSVGDVLALNALKMIACCQTAPAEVVEKTKNVYTKWLLKNYSTWQ
jgi:hypothetical protein